MASACSSRVFYVDDDPVLRAVARIALERLGGWSVEVCGSGAEAIEKARHLKPDFILLDVQMPGMDGPETLEALRGDADLADIPVAFVTVDTDIDAVERYRRLGAAGTIAKPFDPLDLAAAVETLWLRIRSGTQAKS